MENKHIMGFHLIVFLIVSAIPWILWYMISAVYPTVRTMFPWWLFVCNFVFFMLFIIQLSGELKPQATSESV